MKANGAKTYPKNTPIIRALAAGEIDLGLPNHYYLMRFKKSDSGFPVEQTFFGSGDTGNLVNIAGIGILKSSGHAEEVSTFVEYLLSPKVAAVLSSARSLNILLRKRAFLAKNCCRQDELLKLTPEINLEKLDDLEGTLKLLREADIL